MGTDFLGSLVRSGRLALVTTLVVVGAGAGLRAQYDVTNLANSGAGSLRAAIEAMNASRPATATINLHVSGNLTLGGSPLPTLNSTTAATIAPVGFGPGARFLIDARPVSGGGANGLDITGAGTIVLAPITILLDRGTGVRVAANAVHLEDVKVELNAGDGVYADQVTDLGSHWLEVKGGSYGIRLMRCQQCTLGLAAVGGRVTTTDAVAAGILLEDGTANRIEVFTSLRCQYGILVTRGSGHALGTPGGGRSVASGHRLMGVALEQTRGVLVANADLDDNVYDGARITGGDSFYLVGVSAARNTNFGVLMIGNTRHIELVDVSAAANGGGLRAAGVGIGAAIDVVVRDCNLGPANQYGLYATNDYQQPRVSAVQVIGGRAFENEVSGVRFTDVEYSRIDNLDAVDNVANGIELIDCNQVEIRRSRLFRNPQYGLWTALARNCSLITSHVAESIHGISADVSTGLRIEGCKIELCRSAGVQFTGTSQSTVTRNLVTNCSGIGINLMHGSNRNVIGPGNELREMTGSAIKCETCDDNFVTGCQVYGRNAQGVSVTSVGIATLGTDANNGTAGNVVQSCLVSGTRDIGVLNRGSPRMLLEGCTIVDGYRGVHANNGSSAQPTQILMTNCIVRDCTREDFSNGAAWSAITARYCFLQDPAHGGINVFTDPGFLDPWRQDYRLHPQSPARNVGDPSLGWPAGSLDAWGNPRVAGPRADIGAHENDDRGQLFDFEPRSAPLQVARTTFRIQWPSSFAGNGSIVLLNVLGPGSPWNLMGLPFPLTPDPFMLLGTVLPAPIHVNTMAIIPPDGVVQGALDYRGALYGVPGPFSIYGAAIAFDARANGLQVSNVARFDLQ